MPQYKDASPKEQREVGAETPDEMENVLSNVTWKVIFDEDDLAARKFAAVARSGSLKKSPASSVCVSISCAMN